MANAQTGDTVKVHYTGRLGDGTIFDNSEDREPLEFTIGDGKLIPGFENGVIGMQVGEQKEIEVAFEDAYGAFNEEMLVEVPRKELPAEFAAEIGEFVEISDQDGNTFLVQVMEVDKNTVVLDGNHPLAGEDLIFNLKLVAIV